MFRHVFLFSQNVQISKAISLIARSKLRMFVLVWIHFSRWFQILVTKFQIVDNFWLFLKFRCRLLMPVVWWVSNIFPSLIAPKIHINIIRLNMTTSWYFQISHIGLNNSLHTFEAKLIGRIVWPDEKMAVLTIYHYSLTRHGSETLWICFDNLYNKCACTSFAWWI
mgnify:CR=1 FL=1